MASPVDPLAAVRRRWWGSARRASATGSGTAVFRIRSVQSLLAAFFFVLATVVMTWPLARDVRSGVPNHDDAYFHMWRIAWVAHQLPRAPRQLFDANIFAPMRDTLALSDAALLQSLIAAPAIWLGTRTILIYNLLLLGSMAASAWCAYLLAMRLTGAPGPSLLAGFIFGFGPYKFAHFPHLELQASMWMPLAFSAVHRLAFGPGESSGGGDKSAFRGAGVALGAVLAMQALSALYYFMFLAIALAVMVAVLFAAIPAGDKRRLVSGLVVAAVVALAVVVPYSRPYSRVRRVVGTRSSGEVAQFSGHVSDYARGGLGRWEHKPDNSGEERVLSPGLLAPALAVVALWPPLDAWRVASAAVLAVAFDGSLGTNGYFFGAARGLVPALDGLRAAARFAVVVLLVPRDARRNRPRATVATPERVDDGCRDGGGDRGVHGRLLGGPGQVALPGHETDATDRVSRGTPTRNDPAALAGPEAGRALGE